MKLKLYLVASMPIFSVLIINYTYFFIILHLMIIQNAYFFLKHEITLCGNNDSFWVCLIISILKNSAS